MAFVYRCGLLLMLCLYFMGDSTLARKCPLECEKNYQPICGSNGVTYGNKCHFKMAKCKIPGLKISHKGECKTGEECPTICTAQQDPVCGSDGKTYSNPSCFGNAQCLDPTLTLAHTGACKVCPPPEGAGICVELCEDCKAGELCCSNGCGHVCMEAIFPECPESCTEQYEPVCGSDKKTYDNHCYFNNAKCKEPSLTIVDEGACKEECPTICTAQYDPVCGSDGKTYSNLGCFGIAQCLNSTLTLAHPGACKEQCPELCPEIYDPVCGSDGKTYGNDCKLLQAICNNSTLSKIGDGLCDGGTEMLKKN